MDDNPEMIVFGLITTNEKSHDLGFGIDFSTIPGRFHHLAFFVDSQAEHLRSAEILLEAGMKIEYGPGRHGMGEQSYIYFREPGGLRLEINTSGYRNYVPDWKPIAWLHSQGSNTMYRNISMPEAMMDAFPPAPEPAAADLELPPVLAGTKNPWAKHG
jgi:catechol 2,3-dioxygenase